MEDITLKVDHLKAGYDGKTVLNDISFDVKKGEIRMILGSSGCGKSTLMNNILKLYKSESGTITFFGKQFGAKEGLDFETRLRTGVLFQNGALLGHGDSLIVDYLDFSVVIVREHSRALAGT